MLQLVLLICVWNDKHAERERRREGFPTKRNIRRTPLPVTPVAAALAAGLAHVGRGGT